MAHFAETQSHVVLGEGLLGITDPKASACMLGPQDVVVARTGAPIYSYARDLSGTGFRLVRLTCPVEPPLYQEL